MKLGFILFFALVNFWTLQGFADDKVPQCGSEDYIVNVDPQRMTKNALMGLLEEVYSFRVMDLVKAKQLAVEENNIRLVLKMKAEKDSSDLHFGTVIKEISEIPGVLTIECDGPQSRSNN